MLYTSGQTVTVKGQIMTVEESFTLHNGKTMYWLTDGEGNSDWYGEEDID